MILNIQMAYKSILPRLSLNLMYRSYTTNNEGIKCPGTTYYPRFPEKEDPPCEPAKLFMVQRIKAVKGNPYWEKKILEGLGLIGKSSDIAIVKNIPENNARLWKIKHLVKITPITYPNGPPTEDDYGATFLKENGELIVTPRIKVDERRVQASETFEKDKLKLDGETLRKDSRLKWLRGW